MSNLTVSPAYGRDYKSQKEVKQDWEENKDFFVQSMFQSGYINKQDALAQGITSVNVRYKRLTQVCVIKVK
jgi:hypothetical protein